MVEKVLARNRKASHDYFLQERFEAGLALQGSEIKSIRAGQVSLKEAYVRTDGRQAWLVNAHIAPYNPAASTGHNPLRERKLLLHRKEIDLLVLATLSPDYLLPATAPGIQHRLGLNCAAMDVGAACAGFMYALVTGMQYVATGASKYALVIGSDTNSRVMNPEDKKTYPLFGDGAGAVLVTKGSAEQGLLAYTLGADGSGERLLVRPEGGSRASINPGGEVSLGWFVRMDGRPVFKWAVRLLQDSSQQVLDAAGYSKDDVRAWIWHQANIRILDAASDSMEIDRQRVMCNLVRYGNTSAGSVPIALDEALREGRFGPGDLVVMCGFGGGLSWGTTLMRW